jgi:UDP-glucose 4-epimerase
VRYLVTGGAGFIGSHVVEELVSRGHEVTVLDDFSAGKEDNLAPVAGKVRVIRGTITDAPTCHAAAQGADYVLHLAARTSVPRSVAHPAESNHINIDGTLNVLIAARAAKVKRFVFAASSSAYGESPALPKVETMMPAPISPYGVTKLTGEAYAQAFGKAYGLENVSLRYFNVFGPRQDPHSPYSGVLARFCLALLQGQQPVVYGDGEQTRDFTYVANVVDATLRAAETPGATSLVCNVGTGGRFSLNHTLQLLGKISGKPAAPRYDPPRTGDIRDSQADITLARQALGYVPSVGFEEGLRRTWEWYQQAPQ